MSIYEKHIGDITLNEIMELPIEDKFDLFDGILQEFSEKIEDFADHIRVMYHKNKKLDVNNIHPSDSAINTWWGDCPTCGGMVSFSTRWHGGRKRCCCYCGQALNWGEIDDGKSCKED